nr:MAG TPA: hypothetical protein [Caudoviricetes sp.]
MIPLLQCFSTLREVEVYSNVECRKEVVRCLRNR